MNKSFNDSKRRRQNFVEATNFLCVLLSFSDHLNQDDTSPINIPNILPGPDDSIDIHWKTDEYEMLVNIDGYEVNYYGDARDDDRLKIRGKCRIDSPLIDSPLSNWFKHFELKVIPIEE